MTSQPSNFIVAAVAVGLVSAVHAERFEIDVDASAASVVFDFSVPFTGTLIGDFDAETNPDGTQTRPGLFGGSGNNQIPCDLLLTVGSNGSEASPQGTIDLDLAGIAANEIAIESIDIDLLGDDVQTVEGEFILRYETFNTVNPFSLYPGGIDIPIPIAGAEILRSEISRSDSFTVSVVASPDGIEFNAVVPVTWTIEFDAGAGPQLQEVPVAMPFIGSITGPSGGRRIDFGGAVAESGEEPLDVPVGPVPVPLPTIPPGNTANLVFSGSLTSVQFSTDLAFSIGAVEVAAPVFGDLDGDGRVGSSDLGLLISSWGPCPGCSADLNQDGRVDARDLGELIVAWSA